VPSHDPWRSAPPSNRVWIVEVTTVISQPDARRRIAEVPEVIYGNVRPQLVGRDFWRPCLACEGTTPRTELVKASSWSFLPIGNASKEVRGQAVFEVSRTTSKTVHHTQPSWAGSQIYQRVAERPLSQPKGSTGFRVGD
jgi:hypothetical protein